MAVLKLLTAKILRHTPSKISLTFGYSWNSMLRIKDRKFTITDVPAITVYQIGTLVYQEVVLKATVPRFLCLVKLPSSKPGHSLWSRRKFSSGVTSGACCITFLLCFTNFRGRFFKLDWCHSFQICFFGMKGGTLNSLIISPGFLLFWRYLPTGNITYSVKPLSKSSKILADVFGQTNWWDAKW